MYLMDSIQVVGNEDIMLFNAQLKVGGAEHCTDEIIAGLSGWLPYDPNSISSLHRRSDTVFYYNSGSTSPFFFLPKAELGESWTVVSTHSANTYQQITITCASIEEESFWGVTDSVKTFTMAANGSSPGQVPVSSFTMKLSRTYGLLEFVPFHLFLVHPPSVNFISTRCLGIDRNGSKIGFELPDLLEHFNLSPGDLRFWHQVYQEVMQPPVNTYFLDSITDVTITADTIHIAGMRWTEQPNIGISGPVQWVEVYTNRGSGAILECPAGWLAAGSDEFWNTLDWTGVWIKEYISFTVDPVTEDTVVTTHLGSSGYSVDTLSCFFSAPVDVGLHRTIRTGVGLVEDEYWPSTMNYPLWRITLIGSRIGGVVNGPIALSMREHNSSTEAPMLFPNPVNDLLFIRDHHSGQPRMCEVIDASGKVVLSTQYLGDGIQVSDLPAGIYVLRIHDISGQQHARFVKY
jgi:hypothetical protein